MALAHTFFNKNGYLSFLIDYDDDNDNNDDDDFFVHFCPELGKGQKIKGKITI